MKTNQTKEGKMKNMKMLNEDFEALASAIRKSQLFTQDMQTEYRLRGFSEERFRWDCLHMSGYKTVHLYAYLNDTNIDTALQRIVSELSEAY
jgi:hypothetical protein